MHYLQIAMLNRCYWAPNIICKKKKKYCRENYLSRRVLGKIVGLVFTNFFFYLYDENWQSNKLQKCYKSQYWSCGGLSFRRNPSLQKYLSKVQGSRSKTAKYSDIVVSLFFRSSLELYSLTQGNLGDKSFSVLLNRVLF